MIKGIICKVCGKVCKTLSGLANHLRCAHNKSGKIYYDEFLKKDGQEGICKYCGKETTFTGMGDGYRNYCSSKCAASDPKIFKPRVKKFRETSMKNHGTIHPMKSKKILEKRDNTCNDRYGVANPMSVPSIRQKMKDTMKDKYGSEEIFQVTMFKDKRKEFFISNFGVESNASRQENKEKVRHTCQNKYGVDNVFQTSEVIEKSKTTCADKYGVDYYSQTDKARKHLRECALDRISEQGNNGMPVMPSIGKHETICLNELENIIQYKIIRNSRVIGYFPDGYIKELNLIIEFDEPHHYQNDQLSNLDIYRQNQLINELNCTFFRIKEEDWFNNKEMVLESFRSVLLNSNREGYKKKTIGSNIK